MAVGHDGGMWRRPTSADQRRVNYLVECHVAEPMSGDRQAGGGPTHITQRYPLARVVLYYDWPRVMTGHTCTVILGLSHVVL